MRQLLNTLFVTTPNAYLRLEGDTVCVEFSTGQILTHFKIDIWERLAHRIHHPNTIDT
jgi:hypothetical protein